MKKQSLLILSIILLSILQSFGQINFPTPFYLKDQNYIPKFVNSLGETQNSVIYENNNKIRINGQLIDPSATLHIISEVQTISTPLGMLLSPPPLSLKLQTFSPSYFSPASSTIDFVVNQTQEIDSLINTARIELFRNFSTENKSLQFQLSGNLKLELNSTEGAKILDKLLVNSGNNQNPFTVQIAGNSKFIVNSNGGASIGTSSNAPADGLYVYGNTGMGTSSPNSKLHINGASDQTALRVQVNGSSKFIVNSNGSVTVGSTTAGPNNGMFVNGSVGIGTSNVYNYKLAVAGAMIAEEVVVKLRGEWADHVFEDDYNLRSLSEVKNFINENKHLPNFPSAKEMKETGINIEEISSSLLEKIEELTLYTIHQQEMIEELWKISREQQKIIEELQK